MRNRGLGGRYRITSYNVCYTKLLRAELLQLARHIGRGCYPSFSRMSLSRYTDLHSWPPVIVPVMDGGVLYQQCGAHHRFIGSRKTPNARRKKRRPEAPFSRWRARLAAAVALHMVPHTLSLFRRHVAEAIAEPIPRITSYNVCYTKLLRTCRRKSAAASGRTTTAIASCLPSNSSSCATVSIA